jgi:hypothetical protein
MEQRTSGCRRGLAVLLHEGAAAWIEAWGRCATPPVATEFSPRAESSLPANQQAEVVHLLVNMALDNLEKEIRA